MTLDWRAQTQATDGGHLLWTGRLNNGCPIILRNWTKHSVRAHIYQEHHGRPPVNHPMPICRIRMCVTPEHLADYDDRQEIYRAHALRLDPSALDGWCRLGHAWAGHARFDPSGARRCLGCRDGVEPDLDEAAVEDVAMGAVLTLNRPERLEAVRVLTMRNASANAIARRIGVTPRTVTRWRAQNEWRRPIDKHLATSLTNLKEK